MASTAIILRTTRRRKDGTCPLALRITKDRRSSYLSTGQYLSPKYWDTNRARVKTTYKESVWLNNFLASRLAKANRLLAETADQLLSASDLRNKLLGTPGRLRFVDVARERIEQKRAKGTFSVVDVESAMLKNILRFAGSESLSFTEINENWLERLKVYCVHQLNHKPRTVTNHLIFIRTLFNIAMEDQPTLRKVYPFAAGKEKIRIKDGLKIGLNEEEVSQIRHLNLGEGTSLWHTRNVWLFAFYFAGVRISDVLKLQWSDLHDGRLYYVMNKNEKSLSLKVPEKACRILKFYEQERGSNDDFIFPYLKKANLSDPKDVFTKTRSATKQLNKDLKVIAKRVGISKKLSTHIARHTFGNIAGDKIHPLMLQKLYRHSSLRTTINYQGNFIHKDADDALDEVIGF